MRITSPIDGIVVIHGNRDSTGGFFFFGMTLPDYHVGDQVNPGSSIAEAIEMPHLEVPAQDGETDHSNLKPGQPVDTQAYALPNDTSTGTMEAVHSASTHAFQYATS